MNPEWSPEDDRDLLEYCLQNPSEAEITCDEKFWEYRYGVVFKTGNPSIDETWKDLYLKKLVDVSNEYGISKSFPKLIVFDFHGVLCIEKPRVNRNELENNKGDLVKLKNPYFWEEVMELNNKPPEFFIPKAKDLVEFVNKVRINYPNTEFAIASSGESEVFVESLMRYTFRYYDSTSPFKEGSVIGSFRFNQYREDNPEPFNSKRRHIYVIKRNLNMVLDDSEIVLLDDDVSKLELVKPICGIEVNPKFFDVGIWNKNKCGFDKL